MCTGMINSSCSTYITSTTPISTFSRAPFVSSEEIRTRIPITKKNVPNNKIIEHRMQGWVMGVQRYFDLYRVGHVYCRRI